VAIDRSSGAVGRAVAPTVRNHRRFALTEVTFEDQPVGGATVDIWQDAAGKSCWCARVLMHAQDVPRDGVLAGRTRDGGILRGPVSLIGPGPGVGGSRGPVLIEWRGVGALLADDRLPGA
jgi:hypothetical protein